MLEDPAWLLLSEDGVLCEAEELEDDGDADCDALESLVLLWLLDCPMKLFFMKLL
jgi:hypothetical protein